MLKVDKMQHVLEAYNDNYFSYTADISKCPKENCQFAGFIKLEACRENLQCAKCKHEWRDHAQMNTTEKIYMSIRNTMRFNPESFNYLNKVMWTCLCPQCDMPIHKLEG